MHVVTARQMQALDHKTIHDIGIPGAVLMENAGRGTLEKIRHYFPDALRGLVVVLCGRGNNGGDGFVIARYLYNAGIRITVVLFSGIDKVSGDARVNLDAFVKMGGRVEEVADETRWEALAGTVAHTRLFVDALLGTGLSSDVRGLYRRVIEDVNRSRSAVVSVDIPSGLDATTGRVLGAAVQADLTCTFGLPKRGLLIYPGAAFSGCLEVIDIGIPQTAVDGADIVEFLLEESDFRGALAPRRPDTHKGTYGHVCVLAGSPGKTGAAAMTAEAALRTGAGLVTLGVPHGLNAILESKVTEVMTEPLPDGGKGCFGPESLPAVDKLLDGKTVIALGPGIADNEATGAFVAHVLGKAAVPVVIDADGLNAAARNPAALKNTRAPLILTPHPGEMARLMNALTQDVQNDRVGSVRMCAQQFQAVAVLKGARTIIADPQGHIYINPTGNPGMASGGMGDVLTGMLAGLVAQGLAPLAAAQLAVFVHGHIGDCIARERADIGILATDILARIPEQLQLFIAKSE